VAIEPTEKIRALFATYSNEGENNMGLDMYLEARKHIPKVDWAHSSQNQMAVNPQFALVATASKMDHIATDIYGASIEVVCAYWRKANAIHKWFVQFVQEGVDDCETYTVSVTQLKQLRDLCQKAVDSKNPALLPPQEGFFFGGTDIDQWYWKSITDTIEQLDRILNLPDIEELNFFYHSSW